MNAKSEPHNVVDLPVTTGGERTGGLVIVPSDMGQVIEFAQLMARSNFVPGHLRGKPADCVAVALQAYRWEMDPFAVAQKTYFTRDGAPPGYEAQLIAAVVLSRAPLDGRLDVQWEGTGEQLACIVTGKFKGDARAKARRVEMRNITTRNSPLWKTDPQQQIAYYTIRAWARLYCPDVILGVYTKDEIMEGNFGPDNAVDVTPQGQQPAARDEAPRGKLDRLAEQLDPELVIDADPGEAHEVKTAASPTPAPEPAPETAAAATEPAHPERVENLPLIPMEKDANGNLRVGAWCKAVQEMFENGQRIVAPEALERWHKDHTPQFQALKKANTEYYDKLNAWLIGYQQSLEEHWKAVAQGEPELGI